VPSEEAGKNRKKWQKTPLLKSKKPAEWSGNQGKNRQSDCQGQ